MASKKNIAKSIRISEEVFAYIDQAPGNGFNEKFENIILEAKKTEAYRKQRLAELEEKIHDAEQKLLKLLDQNREVDRFFRTFIQMQHTLHGLKDQLDRIAAVPEEKPDNND